MTINVARLSEEVARAKAKASDSPRWVKAIERAEKEIAENPYFHFDESGHLVVLSPRSRRINTVNGRCSCEAAERGDRICVHRAMKRILINLGRA